MKTSKNNGYSMIEIGIGILMLTIFAIASFSMFNGSYNKYRMVQQRTYAMEYAIEYIEKVLTLPVITTESIGDDMSIVFTGGSAGIYMYTRNIALANAVAYEVPSTEELAEGKYVVPEDTVIGPTETIENEMGETEVINNTRSMRITVKIRRVPAAETSGSYNVYDEKVLKVIVDVEYKVKPSDAEYQKITLEALKVIQ